MPDDRESKARSVADLRATPAIQGAAAFIKRAGLPAPAQPQGYGQEYDFPDDVNRLSLAELGNLRLKLSRLHGYALRLLSIEEGKLSPLEEVFTLKRDLAVGEAVRGWDRGRVPAVEVLRAIAINEDERLADLQQELIELRAVVGRLKAQIAIYDRHLQDLSREQARRSDEAHSFQ